MEMIQTQFNGKKKEIQACDTEILNHKLHVLTLVAAIADPSELQECIALGLSKGGILFLHVHQLDRVFCRFTIHRNAIMNIKYLPKAKVFLSICQERHLKIWRINNREKKVNVIYSFRLEKEIDFLFVMNTETEDMTSRFLMIFKTGESEIFEYNGTVDALSHIEVFKEREHDCRITSCDFNPKINLLMTADTSGSIRFWTKDKKYIREI